MIFVTVGTQLAFPRLVDALNMWAADTSEEVIAQTLQQPRDWPNLTCHPTLEPAAFEDLFGRARVVVGHAGIGTILSAFRHSRPLIILPRRLALGEHRNDHQIATAQAVQDLRGLHVAWQAEEIAALLRQDLAPADETQKPMRATLIARLAGFIDSN